MDSIWKVRGQVSAHTSASRVVFDELRPPMTTIASTAEARSAAASWRWRVAEQMVFFTMGSSPASRRAATTASKFSRRWVVWATTPTGSYRPSGISSGAATTSTLPPASSAQAVSPSTSG